MVGSHPAARRAPAGRRAALLAAALVVAAGAPACGGDDAERAATTPDASTPGGRTATAQARDTPLRSSGGARIETVAEGLEAPWEIAFLPDGRALVTERPGRVRRLSRDGRLREAPVATVEVAAIGEGGLLGLAVDPDFRSNRLVYLYRTTSSGNEVVRYRLEGDELREQAIVASGIAAAAIHDGGRLRFGPDGRLYVTTGDAATPELAQDRSSPNGKILRLEPDAIRTGSGRLELFSLGHRNPQGLDWEPGSGRLVASEHGPDGDDEVNLIRRGANFGWPEVRGGEHGSFAAPAAVYSSSIAPSGASFVRAGGSEWSGDLLVAALVGEQIRRLRFDGARVTLDEALFEGELGRLRTIVEGPDGALYALTSNRDGRGSPRPGDDRVVRIVPPAE